jgi:hypothetical protein
MHGPIQSRETVPSREPLFQNCGHNLQTGALYVNLQKYSIIIKPIFSARCRNNQNFNEIVATETGENECGDLASEGKDAKVYCDSHMRLQSHEK